MKLVAVEGFYKGSCLYEGQEVWEQVLTMVENRTEIPVSSTAKETI